MSTARLIEILDDQFNEWLQREAPRLRPLEHGRVRQYVRDMLDGVGRDARNRCEAEIAALQSFIDRSEAAHEETTRVLNEQKARLVALLDSNAMRPTQSSADTEGDG